jgi:hypothetical protein
MGIQQSKNECITPIPQPPSSPPPLAPASKHDFRLNNIHQHIPQSSCLTSLSADEGRTFKMRKNLWIGIEDLNYSSTLTTSAPDGFYEIVELGLTLYPIRDQSRCLLKSTRTGKTVAVLLMKQNGSTCTVQVCAFTPPRPTGGGQFDGSPPYEWASIRTTTNTARGNSTGSRIIVQTSSSMLSTKRKPNNVRSHAREKAFSRSNLLTKFRGDMTTTYEMATPFDGLFTTTITQHEKRHNIVIHLNGNVAAVLEEDNKCENDEDDNGSKVGSWICRTSQGIDPAMIVCFVAALDRLDQINRLLVCSATTVSTTSISRTIISSPSTSSSRSPTRRRCQ